MNTYHCVIDEVCYMVYTSQSHCVARYYIGAYACLFPWALKHLGVGSKLEVRKF